MPNTSAARDIPPARAIAESVARLFSMRSMHESYRMAEKYRLVVCVVRLFNAWHSYRRLVMAFVIAEPCIGVKDTACVVVCPVDVIHPTIGEQGFESAEQLYIEPTHCVDCGLCAEECPVKAIFHDQDMPPEWHHFIEKNAAF